MRIASTKIKDVVRFFKDELNGLYDDSEIQVFVKFCFEEFVGLKFHELSLRADETISESELLKFNFAVKDLKKYKPIQQILGKADFYGMKFKVNEHVLIPRPETEELVDMIIKEVGDRRQKIGDRRQKIQDERPETEETQNSKLKTQNSILDIGTGSGCIAIALKKSMEHASVEAIDISPEALEIAKYNALQNKVDIHFKLQDILNNQVLSENKMYDIIVSNPPYVRELEKKAMSANVLNYEPHGALFVDDNNPLLYYKAIADYALKHLKKSGSIYLEINEYLGEKTLQLFIEKGFSDVTLHQDINGKNRILRVHY